MGGWRAFASVDQGDGEVVADDHGEEDRVEAVEDAAVGAEEGAGVLFAEVALQHRLEEVADRGDGGDGGADDQGVHAREPVLVEAGEPEAHGADQEAADQALDRLVGGDAGGDPVAAEHAAGRVGGGVGDEGPDQHVDQQAGAVARQVAQEDGVGQRQPDPEDPEQGDADRDRRPVAVAPVDAEGEQQREGGGEDQQDVEGGTEVGGDDQGDDGGVGGDRERPRVLGHRQVLAQADGADRQHRRRESEPAGNRDRDREGDPRQGHQNPFGGLAATAAPPRLARRFGGRRRLVLEHLVVEEVGPHDRAPKRRRRVSYSRREPSNAARSKSARPRERPARSRRTARAGSWRRAARRWFVSGGRDRASRVRRGGFGTPPRSPPESFAPHRRSPPCHRS